MRRLVLVVIAALAAACTGGTGGPGVGATATPLFYPTDTPYSGPASGSWTGTITFAGKVDRDKTEPGHSDLDPSNVYYSTWVTTENVHESATDTFNISAQDDDDLSYGIRSVELTGQATNAGNTNQRSVKVEDKGNSGCTWKEENGNETVGSWSGQGEVSGELHFLEDGSYEMRVNAYPSDYAELTGRSWLSYSDISANCEVNQEPYDNEMPGAPLVEWPSSEQSSITTTNNEYIHIDGQLNASSPGSVVDGSKTWELLSPEGYTITVTWHLVHSGPIVLPHS